MKKAAPVTRLGWHQHYARKAKDSKCCEASHLALWYWLLHLEHDEPMELT